MLRELTLGELRFVQVFILKVKYYSVSAEGAISPHS